MKVSLNKQIQPVLGLSDGPTGFAQALAGGEGGESGGEGSDKGLVSAPVGEPAGDADPHKVGQATDRQGHGWGTTGHRLDHGEGQVILGRGVEQ